MKKEKKKKGMLRRFASFYKPYRGLFVVDLICSFSVAVCNLFYPFIAQNIINDYVPNKQVDLLVTWAIVLLAIYVVKSALNFIIQYWGHILGVRIQGDMRKKLFSHIQTLPFTYFDSTKTGTIMSRIVNDLFEVSELCHHGPEDTFISLVTIIGAFAMLCTINVPLALIVFALLPFMVLFAVLTRRKMSAAFKAAREEIAGINASIESSISGVRVTKAYAAEETELKKFDVSNERFKRARSGAYKSMGIFFSGMGLFNDLLYLVVLVAGGLFFYYNYIDIGQFVAYILYVTMLLTPIRTLVNIFEQMQDGLTGFARFCELCDRESESEPTDPVEIGRLSGDIVFENVTFSYHTEDDRGAQVLTDLNLTVPAGKTLALVGPSGGGKTTLCHLVPRFYELDKGRITIGGTDITTMRRADLRKNVGIVAQDVFLFGGSVRDNIAYGDPNATDEQVREAARLAGIDEFVDSLPHGYDTEVGERGVKLSGGQKQRISIARAFLKNPPILILDEATSALDNVTEMQVQASLSRLSEGRTTIVVAHRLSTVRNADEIVVVTKYGIAERGTHAELLQKQGVYAGLYGAMEKGEGVYV